MHRYCLPILLVLVVGAAGAQPKYGHRDPYEVLEIAAKRAPELRGARFAATVEFKQFDGSETETTRSFVTAMRDTASPIGVRYRVAGDGGDLAVYNGDTMWIGFGDAPLDRFDVRADAEGSARSQTISTLVTRLIFGLGDPFTEIGTDALEIECEGLDTIAGVVCHAMTVRMPDVEDYTGRVRRYSFGADDYVLRRLISETQWEGLTQRMVFTVGDLAVDSAIAPATFSFDESRERRAVKPVVAESGAERREVEMVAVGDVAPSWSLRDPSGAEISLEAMRGKVVVLDFWGTWCKPCVKAMPEIQKLHDEFRDRGVIVVGVNVEHRRGADPAGMMKRKGATYALALEGAPVARAYGITAYPSMIVIGPDGRVLHTARGFGPDTAGEIRAVVAAASTRK